MPLSSNGDSIDFIYGVINWKELADSHTASALENEVDRAIASAASAADCPVWADGPNADISPSPVDDGHSPTLALWGDEPDADEAEEPLPEDAALADRLSLARATAEKAATSDHRSRAALYRALGEAHDFAIAAERDPEGYAELIEDSGIKVQARAPMTAVVKLVFGADYDKTRLTEFAACLACARREGIEAGRLAAHLETLEGGLKAMVQAERRARRPGAEPRPDGREKLRRAPALAEVALPIESAEGDFVLLVARRDGTHFSILAGVADPQLVERAIRKAG